MWHDWLRNHQPGIGWRSIGRIGQNNSVLLLAIPGVVNKRCTRNCGAILSFAILTLWICGHCYGANPLSCGIRILKESVSNSEFEALQDSESETSFDKTIWPIIRENCLSCHGPEKSRGDLRLDSWENQNLGGHSGLRIIGDSSQTSEFYRRIVSQDDEYRMPPKGEGLTDVELKAIESWMDRGSPVEANSLWRKQNRQNVPLGSMSIQDRFWFAIDPWLTQVEKFFEGTWSLAIPFAVFLVAVFLIERTRKSRRRNGRGSAETQATQQSNPGDVVFGIRRIHYLVVLLLFAVTWLMLKNRRDRARLTDDMVQLQNRIDKTSRDRQLFETLKDRQLSRFEIQRPKHPPRLGGEYYRGNDERDERLFNGGFYRTAKMSLRLVNEDGKKLEWGSPLNHTDVFVELEIERANLATTALFTESIMGSIFLSRQRSYEESGIVDQPQTMQNIVPDKIWRSRYRLNLKESKKGTIYVYSGLSKTVPVQAEPHYGITYDLHIENNQIAETSQLWMGSIHNSFES